MIRDTQLPTLFVRTLDAADLPSIPSAPASAANRAQFDGRVAKTMAGHLGSWYGEGINVAADVDALLRDGWADGAAKAVRLADSIRHKLPAPVSVRRRQRWAEDGDSLDADRALSGDWDTAWRTMRRETATAPQTISVAMTWGASAGRAADQLFWSGAAMLALADALEGAGYGCELFAAYLIGCGLTFVRVKGAGDPLQADSVAATFCHAGPYRLYGIPSVAGQREKVDGAWGPLMLDVAPALDTAAAAGTIDPVRVVLPACYDEASAVHAILSAVATVNGEAPPPPPPFTYVPYTYTQPRRSRRRR